MASYAPHLAAQRAKPSTVAAPKPPPAVDRYTMQQEYTYSSARLGSAYRFREPGGHAIDVFVYPAETDSASPGRASAAPVIRAAEKFKAALSFLGRRGVYAYRIAIDTTDSVDGGGSKVSGREVVVVERGRGGILVSDFFVYQIGRWLVKLRSDLPLSRWERPDVLAFRSELLSTLEAEYQKTTAPLGDKSNLDIGPQ